MRRFIVKKQQPSRSPKKIFVKKEEEVVVTNAPKKEKRVSKKETVKEKSIKVENNKLEENLNVMDTKTKIELANAVLDTASESKVKKIKKDKGLIERTESSKTILTEDNRELLRG